MDGYFEEKNGSKYLIFNSSDKNKEVLKNYIKLEWHLKWDWDNKWE